MHVPNHQVESDTHFNETRKHNKQNNQTSFFFSFPLIFLNWMKCQFEALFPNWMKPENITKKNI